MAGGVGVFRAERGAEGVDLGQRAGVRFHIQLTRHRQERFPAEEVAGVVHAAFLVAGQVHHVQRRDAEHLTRAFAIACGHDGRVHPLETVLVEEAVHRLGQAVPNPSDRTERVGAGAQVGDFPQVFERVPFGRHRIGVWIFDQAHHFHFGRLHFDGLALALALGQDPTTHDRTAGGQGLDFGVVGEIALGDHLQGVKA